MKNLRTNKKTEIVDTLVRILLFIIFILQGYLAYTDDIPMNGASARVVIKSSVVNNS